MPSATPTSPLSITPLHKTLGAEVRGVPWQQKTIPDSIIQEIKDAIHKYGVLVFRGANLDNDEQIRFSRKFGELDDVKPFMKAGRRMRFPETPEIFDLANLDENGELMTNPDSMRVAASRGNFLWHVDMAYLPRRCSYALLRAVELPPPGTGGETEFLDIRKAYEDLPPERQAYLETLVMNNSFYHQRKLAAPEAYADLDPLTAPMARHRLVVPHEQSGRKCLFVTTLVHHFDGMTKEESQPLVSELLDWISKPEYKLSVEWHNPGDMIMWDNRAVVHRATDSGSYAYKYRRDVRRTTVKDDGLSAYGENGYGVCWTVGLS